MLDLDETAWKRGKADALKWRGTFDFVFWTGLVALAAGVTAKLAGNSYPIAFAVAGGTGFLAFVGLVLFAFVTAPLRQRNEARAALRESQGTTASRRDELTDLFRRGTFLFRESIKAPAYDEWKVRISTWTDGTADFLLKRYGFAEQQTFLNPPPHNTADVSGSAHAGHARDRLKLSVRLETLRSIMDRGT